MPANDGASRFVKPTCNGRSSLPTYSAGPNGLATVTLRRSSSPRLMRKMSGSTIFTIIVALAVAAGAVYNAVKADHAAAKAEQEKRNAADEKTKGDALAKTNQGYLEEIRRLTVLSTEILQSSAAKSGDQKVIKQLEEAARAAMDVKPEDAADFVKGLAGQIKQAAALKMSEDAKLQTKLNEFHMAWRPAVDTFIGQLNTRLGEAKMTHLEGQWEKKEFQLIETPMPSHDTGHIIWLGGDGKWTLRVEVFSGGIVRASDGLHALILVRLVSNDTTVGDVFRVQFEENQAIVDGPGERHVALPRPSKSEEYKSIGIVMKEGADGAVRELAIRLAIDPHTPSGTQK